MSIFEELVKEQVDNICKKYKMVEDQVNTALIEKLNNNKKLLDIIEHANNLEEIYRTKEFTQFIKKIKREIYFKLRTYQTNSSLSVESHISTKERNPYIKEFLAQLDPYLVKCKTIFDIGGGLFPLMFAFEKYPQLEDFVWMDKDKLSFEKLQMFYMENITLPLRLYCERIGEKPWSFYLPTGKSDFDMVLMLKLIPVITRQEKSLLPLLAKIPCKYMLITGSKEAMVKREKIYFRENKVIKEFIGITGKNIILELDTENEFGYLLS